MMVIERYEAASTLRAGQVYALSPREADSLRDAADALKGLDPHVSNDWYRHAARRAARDLGVPLQNRLRAFTRDSGDTGYLLVRGSHVGPVPPTPRDNWGAVGRHTLPARETAVLTAGIGGSMVAGQAALGVLHQDLVPAGDKQRAWVSQASRMVRETCADQYVHDPGMRPDFVVLACLRGDPCAVTYTFTARQLASCLTSKEVASLRRPLWIAPFPVCGPGPILGGSEHDPTLIADPDVVRGITPDAQDLLSKVLSLYERHRNSYLLQRGDILILDHRRAMYARSTFRAQFDGGDRFLVRTLAMRDPHPHMFGRHRPTTRAQRDTGAPSQFER